MENLDASTALKEKIKFLEGQRAEQLRELKGQLDEMYDNLKPSNMIKNLFKDITQSPETKSTIVDYLMGLTGGLLTRKIVIGKTHNPIKKMLGGLIQAGVSGIVTANSGSIKQAGLNLLSGLFRKKEQPSYQMNGNGSHGVANEPYYE